MREILFRGKRDYNGEWVEGSLLAWPDGSTEMCYPNPKDGDELLKVIVWPETVGQFTGTTDKNGKRIFEGDILFHPFHKFLVIYEKTWARFKLQHLGREIMLIEWINAEQMEVVGNIHDNPELLGGTVHE